MISRIEILNPKIETNLGKIKYALIDFDGTISVIRQGWEEVMIPLMIEIICEGNLPSQEIIQEVTEYVDYSTGILTIKQMEWMVEAARRHGIASKIKTALEYKRIYNERLLVRVDQRLEKLRDGKIKVDDLTINGSRDFLKNLYKQGIKMFLASGTDNEYVKKESSALNVYDYFKGGVYGALDHTEANTKERIIRRILQENKLEGKELLVIGDGPVEIRNAKARNAIALGVATNEIKRYGLNSKKRKRLIKAGADLIIPDFRENKSLVNYLLRG